MIARLDVAPSRAAPLRQYGRSSCLFGLVFIGCIGGPDYAGGPRADEPHAIVDPGSDVTVWAVDGQTTSTRAGKLRVAPGLRVLRVRVEHPIDSESPRPYDIHDLPLRAAEGVWYRIERDEGDYPSYGVRVLSQRMDH